MTMGSSSTTSSPSTLKKTTAMYFSEIRLDFADLLTRPSCGDGEVKMERVSTRIGKKTSGAQSFYVFPSAPAFFMTLDGLRKKKVQGEIQRI